VNTVAGSGPTPGSSIRYQVAKTTTIYDGDFYVKTFGYGDQDIPTTLRDPNGVYVLNDDPAPDPAPPATPLPAGSYPTSRPLTAFGYRPGSNRTVGWGKTGRATGGTNDVSIGFIYENATVNTFQVYAYRRCTYNGASKNVCDLFLLIGHPRWNSVFGTVTYSSTNFGPQLSAQLKMSGSTNVLAVTMLLSTTNVDIPAAQLQTIVQNLTARMKLFFYF
jgi:hypothetical protein